MYMQRKALRHGQTSLVVSLPKKWVDAHNIQAGDALSVQEHRGAITYSTAQVIRRKQLDMQLTSESGTRLRNALVSAYRLGYQDVQVSCTPKQLPDIERVVQELLPGWQIKEVTQNSAHIQGVAAQEQSFAELQRKFFLNLGQLFRILLGEESADLIDSVQRILQVVDNQLRRSIMASAASPELAWSFQSELMRAQRELYRLPSQDVEKTLLRRFANILAVVQEARESLSLEKITHTQKLLSELCSDALDKNTSAQMYAAARMLYLSMSPLFGLAHLERGE